MIQIRFILFITLCVRNVDMQVPLGAFHSLIVASLDADKTIKIYTIQLIYCFSINFLTMLS